MYSVERFLDGTKPTKEYLQAVASLVASACIAEEHFSADELEEFARKHNSLSSRVEQAKKQVDHEVDIAAWYATVQLDEDLDVILGDQRDPYSPVKQMASVAFLQLELAAKGAIIFSGPWCCDLHGVAFRYVIKTYPFIHRRGVFQEYEGDRFVPISSIY